MCNIMPFKKSFSSGYFIAADNHIKTIRSHSAVFKEYGILFFLEKSIHTTHYPMKVPQNCFDFFELFKSALDK